MSKESTLKGSQTDWKRVASMSDEEIDTAEIPEVTEEQVKRASIRVGGMPVSKGKVRINILLDAEVIAYFKYRAGGRGYQSLINEALKESIRGRDLESAIRRIIREELGAAR